MLKKYNRDYRGSAQKKDEGAERTRRHLAGRGDSTEKLEHTKTRRREKSADRKPLLEIFTEETRPARKGESG